MKEKIQTQGFIQIPLLIAIIAFVIAATGVSYGGFEYYKTSKIIKEAEQLSKEEKYDEAIRRLEFAQNKWLTNNLGLKRQKINDEIEANKKLLEDKSEYIQGIEEFNKGNWEKAKELLSKVSEISPYHRESKSKIEEIQKKTIEKQVSEAVEKATKEAEQRIEEKQKRILTEAKTKKNEKDEQEIKEILQKQSGIFSKGIKRINDSDLKGLYELYTPNYRKKVSFTDFSQYFTENIKVLCEFFDFGKPVIINVKEIFRHLYYNDPEFSDIRKEISWQELWEHLEREMNVKEKMTIQEWNDVNKEEEWFSEEEIIQLLKLCQEGKMEITQIKIQIEEYSEGEWARVTYKIKRNNQEIPEFESTEENPDIFRKVGERWYWVETDKNAPGFNKEDLPPPIRGIVKAQEKEISEELKKELEKLFLSQPPPGFQISELVKIVGKYIVGVACINYDGSISRGSGIIYGAGYSIYSSSRRNSIILTNYHIVKDANVILTSTPCIVGYSDDPTKGFTDFYLAAPVYWPDIISETDMKLIDFYFLSIEEKITLSEHEEFRVIPNASLILADDYAPRVCSSDNVEIGKEILVLGYPTIGGEYLTATDGIISGFEGTYYLTTSAKIEQGSSGGGAFLKSTGCLVGMSTFVRLGRIEAFGRLINMAYLKKNYLSKIWK